MLSPRWKKVWSDLWSNGSRTALVVISIVIGVFATGVINGARAIVVRELQISYRQTNPAHVTIRFSEDDSFDDELIQSIRKVDGVAAAEGRRSSSVEVEVLPGVWETLQLTAIPDFEDITISHLRPIAGALKPRDKEVLIERSSMNLLGASIGDRLTIEQSDGKQRIITLAGVTHDLAVRPTAMSGTIYGYVTLNTLEWLGESPTYTQMLIRVEPEQADVEPSMSHITAVIDAVNQKIEKSNRIPQVPRGPHGNIANEHWATTFITSLSIMMAVLGVMSLFLSGFLVTNTISALLAQQIQQIGIMKSLGARSSQLISMYIVLTLGFGLLAMALAIPLTLVTTNLLVTYVADFFNFDLSQATFPLDIAMIQVFASLAIPVLASLAPVIMGARITIYQAINSDLMQVSTKKKKPRTRPSPTATLMATLATMFERPTLLAIRNTFRRKGRVILTLLTLTVSGFIFIGIFTIRNSLLATLDNFIARELKFDAVLNLERTYNDYTVVNALAQIPGVFSAEPSMEGSATRVYDNGNESGGIQLSAVFPESEMINPMLAEGRWLLPDDQNAIVVTLGVLTDDPDIEIGSDITLMINGRESVWHVVGMATGMSDQRAAYVNYDFYGRITSSVGKTRSYYITFDSSDPTIQTRIESTLSTQGIRVQRIFAIAEMQARMTRQFDFIVMALIVMALLMAVVGGLGLAGTMSLNVIERTREIGIMRAIGASDSMIVQIFLSEGIVIGMMSWILGVGIALPLTKLLSDAMGMLFFGVPLDFRFSLMGTILWFVLSFVLAILSSWIPAWNATRLTVRDALAYM